MGIYYDFINEITTENRIDSFLDRLIELNDERNGNEIKRILNLNGNFRFINVDKQDNETNFKYVSVKSNDYIRRTLDVTRHIIAGKVFTTWIENVLNTWINKVDKKPYNEINLMFKECDFKGCYESNRIVNFTVNEDLWKSFVIRCKRSNLTNADGFKYAVIDYIINVSTD